MAKRTTNILIAGTFLVASLSVCRYAHSFESSGRDAGAQKTEEPSQSQQTLETMLHSLALYILAVEILSYLEDGAGGTDTLTQRYATHPGWIPAFGKAMHDPENHVLYVPLGQCVWKILLDVHGDTKFGLLQPTDSQLDENDRKILTVHLFRLMNDADLRKDHWAATRNALAAETLLYPNGRRSGRSVRKSGSPVLRGEKDPSDHL